jgi:benzoylformate decarboxylase
VVLAELPVLNQHLHGHPKRSAAGAERRNQRLRTLHDGRKKDWEQFRKAVQSVPGKELVPPSLVAVALREIQDDAGKDGWTLAFVNEAISASKSFQEFLAYDVPTSYYGTEGGSLGYSMPASIGISEALRKREPKRIVVNAVGDGSALFYPQVWWTIAKDGLPVLTIVMNNRRYQTLITGLDEIEKLYRWKPSGPTDYLYLRKPEIKFVDIARTYGIEHGDTVTKASELKPKLQKAIEVVQAGSPYVLDVLVAPADPKPAPRLDVFVASLEGKK